MTEGPNFEIYSDAMIVLATAAVLVPLGQRFKLSPILGFLIAGAMLGPHGLGALKVYFPILHWVTISEEKGLGAIAELGVVFLLFLIGIELSFKRLLTMASSGGTPSTRACSKEHPSGIRRSETSSRRHARCSAMASPCCTPTDRGRSRSCSFTARRRVRHAGRRC